VTDGPPAYRRYFPSSWPLWRWGILRSTGFPCEGLSRLATSEAARAVDALLDAQAQVQAAAAQALAAIERCAPSARRTAAEVARRLRAGTVPERELERLRAVDEAAAAQVSAWRAAAARAGAASEHFVKILETELAAARASLRELVADPRIREATLWQSPSALEGLDALAHDGLPARNRKVRQREQLAAMYLQRYLAKNDAIGFFGPRAWFSVGNQSETINFRPGPELLDRRDLYFEHWAVWQLAERIAADPEVRAHLCPVRSPRVAVVGTTLFHPVDQRAELPPAYARLLHACDGTRSALQLAQTLATGGDDGFDDAHEALEALDELESQTLVTRHLAVPTCDYHPERLLAAALASLPSPLADRYRPLLDELEHFRSGLSAAQGAEARGAVLADLNRWFESATGGPASRGGGQMYAARAVVFEDCTRNLSLDVGAPFFARIAAPLSLALLTSRWYLAELGKRVLLRARAIYQQLAVETGRAEVDYLRLWIALEPEVAALPDAVNAEVQAVWHAALAARDGERQVERSAAALRPALEAAFAGARPDWPSARFHSPDLLIAAASPEAVARGDYRVIVGELHVGLNSVGYPVSVKQAPDEEAIIAACHAEMPPGFVVPSITNAQYHRAIRFDYQAPHIVELCTSPGTVSRFPPAQRIDLGELVVFLDGERLRARTRDGRYQADLAQVLDAPMRVGRDLRLFSGDHQPRVTVDGLVLGRETWRLPPPVLDEREEPLLSVRRWARAHGLPRRVFVKLPEETKPFLLDLENPFLVEVFARLAPRSTRLTVSEMLPGPDELWLVDAQGRHYTGELRLVFLDPEAT
jgi:hypothetical protein